jgi:hypothetical protein
VTRAALRFTFVSTPKYNQDRACDAYLVQAGGAQATVSPEEASSSPPKNTWEGDSRLSKLSHERIFFCCWRDSADDQTAERQRTGSGQTLVKRCCRACKQHQSTTSSALLYCGASCQLLMWLVLSPFHWTVSTVDR